MADDYSKWTLVPAEQGQAQYADWKLMPAAAAPQSAPDGPSALAAAGKGFVQGGTVGFGDELAGAGQAGLQFLATHPTIQRIVTAPLYGQLFTPEKDLLLQPNTDASGEAPVGAGDVYRTARDAARRENEAAAKARPLAYAGGNIAGALVTAKPLGALAGVVPGLQGTRAARILKQGAALGGLASLGNSNASEPGQLAADTVGVTGAQQALDDVGGGRLGQGALDLLGAGALGGLGAGTAAEVAPTLFRGLGSRAEEFGIGQARRALANLSQGLSTKKQLPADSAREALQSGALLPGSAHANAKRLGGLRQTLGDQLGAVIKRLADLGVRAPADPIINELGALEATSRPNTLNESVPAAYRKTAQQVIDKLGPADTLGVDQLEHLKRSAQEKARTAYTRMKSTELGEAQKKIASVLREANENAIEAAGQAAPVGSEIQENAETFRPLKERLARVIPAAELAEMGSMRGGNRSLLGLPGHQILAEGLTSGEPGKTTGSFMAAIANSLLHHVGPSTSAYGSYQLGRGLRRLAPALDTPTMRALMLALQRGTETAKAKAPPTSPIGVDEEGRPILVVHTGPQ